MRSSKLSLTLFLTLSLAACTRDVSGPSQAGRSVSQSVAPDSGGSDIIGTLPDGSMVDRALAARHVNAKLNAVFLMVAPGYPLGMPTVYTNDRNRYLPSQFVEHDLRRGNYVGLTWTFDARRGEDQNIVDGTVQPWTTAESVDAARLAVNTWTGLSCYKAFFAEVPYPVAPGFENIELIDDLFLGGETQPFQPVAEITFGGFLPYTFFRNIFGSDQILGVTYQFSFVDGNGQFTDIDHNGYHDTYWTEIYFNDLYYWGDVLTAGFDRGNPQLIDMGTVGLHESGHAFGLDHFGRVFDTRNWTQIATYNIMTQVYIPNRSVTGEASSRFCDTYSRWH